mmetsp:Transcript_20948/g.45275  ORF Transcript_20948/g.45275 Transcript_20948/m.45275 type:complete len:165 (+) Transcript_20948:1923-2417(+)
MLDCVVDVAATDSAGEAGDDICIFAIEIHCCFLPYLVSPKKSERSTGHNPQPNANVEDGAYEQQQRLILEHCHQDQDQGEDDCTEGYSPYHSRCETVFMDVGLIKRVEVVILCLHVDADPGRLRLRGASAYQKLAEGKMARWAAKQLAEEFATEGVMVKKRREG